MEQKPFDKTIKNALENYKASYNAAHWQQMEGLLNNLPVGDETDKDARFDALIKSKIDNIDINAASAASGWTAIDAALTNAEAVDMSFDQLIKTKVTNASPNIAPNWDSFEKALEAEEAIDTQFDAQIQQKIQHIHKPYKVSHWQDLLNRLETDFAMRDKLYRLKLWEVAVMILFLLNLIQYLPSNPVVKHRQANQKISQQPQSSPIHQPAIIAPISEASIAKQENAISETTETQSQVPSVAKNVTIEPMADANLLINKVLSSKSTWSIAKLNQQAPSFNYKNELSISVSEMNQHLAKYTETGNSIIETVPSLQPDFVESLHIIPLGCKDCERSKIPARLRLGVSTNIAFNNAYRSGGQLLNISALNQKGFGYGSGFSLGFKYARWEIETGLNYAAKQYDPNIVDRYDNNYRRTHFQRIHLQTLHIPINLRYNYAVLGKGRWHLYAQTGTALNVILRAEYDLAQLTAGSRSQNNAITTSRLSQIDYNKGFLAGDGFKENRYISISMGAGVERYITPTLSTFVQPDFHFHFSGNRIGPTQDRINTLAISFGLRKSL